MRNLRALALVLLAGCGMSEDKFWEKYEATYCEEWDACHTGDEQCPFVGLNDGAVSGSDSECEFDPAQARACLKGVYECEDMFGPGLEVVKSPAECEGVYLCAVEGVDTSAEAEE